MGKKPKNWHEERHLLNAGICFEPLEPRLLLSGSWGAVVDGPGPDSQADTRGGGLTQGSVVFHANSGITGVGSEHRSLTPENGRVDLLSKAPVLNPLGNAAPALDASLPSSPAVPVTNDTSTTPVADQSDALSNTETIADTVESVVRRELVFVNDNVSDYESLINDLQGSDTNRIMEVVVLDSNHDGIQEVSDILADRSNLSAVHFIAHGSDGQINLGDTWLNSASLVQNSDAVAGWGSALTETGDILFYGCNVAADSGGLSLLDNIAELTGAEVSASDDLTGNSEHGGDWVLEYRTGSVEASVALDAAEQAEYQGVLNAYVVSNTDATGFGSLHQAITDANANTGVTDTITFNIGGGGPQTIAVAAGGLPIITDSVILNATTQPGYSGTPLITLDGSGAGAVDGLALAAGSDGSTIRGLVINRFGDTGIKLIDSDNHTIVGNYIGTDLTGTLDRGNATKGIQIENSAGNLIGGSNAADRNVIAGNNDDGIIIWGSGSTLNIIQGNLIGTDITGTADLANIGAGISLDTAAANNLIGGASSLAGNTIAFNTGDGVRLFTAAGTGNAILGNQIFSNAGDGIDLKNDGVTVNDSSDGDTGPNNLQNFPVLTRAVTNTTGTVWIDGTLNSNASSTFRIEFFADAVSGDTNGEGQTYLGFTTVTTDGAGDATFEVTASGMVAAGAQISATATNAATNDTSEFALNVVTATGTLVVTTTTDAANGDTSSVAALIASDGGDGISLREALAAANNSIGTDTISFNIPGTGVHTLSVGSALPTITDTVTLDATTDDSFAANGNRPAIILDGNDLAADGLVLTATADGSTIRGLVIRDFGGDGIQIDAGSDGNTIAGNYIGRLTETGTDAGAGEENSGYGVYMRGNGNMIGGTTPEERNILSGNGLYGAEINGTANTLQGSYIGVDATGTAILANNGGVMLRWGSGNTIGGTTAGAGNVISGNNGAGIFFEGGSGHVVQGNVIGTDLGGTQDLGNTGAGLHLQNAAADHLIGGTENGAGNHIAYNDKGINLANTAGTGNSLLGNSISSNGNLGIDLLGWGVTANDADDADTGANNLQNFPVLTSAVSSGGNTTITGTFNSNASTNYRVEFFSSPTGDAGGYGEGQTYLGFATVTTDGSGNASINETLTGVTLTAGHLVSATATVDLGGGNYGDTSEFALNVTAVAANNAPVLSGANDLTTINEDPTSNPGTPVSDLIAGKVTDADTGALYGIAVTAVDDTNGTWQYTTNSGGLWTDFAAVSESAARLLAADANTYLRFVPNADWNGTVSDGITFHAWDQTSGSNGGTADLRTFTVLDQFTTAAFTNDDGTAGWAGGWIETDSGGAGTGAGKVQVLGGELRLNGTPVDGNDPSVAREVDLSAAASASMSFDFRTGSGVESADPDSVVIEISDNGGSTWNLLEAFDSFDGVNAGSRNYDISAYMAVDTQIRFRVDSGYGGPDEFFYVDNIRIEYTNDSPTAFSTATASSSITVNPVNDASVLNNSGLLTLTTITEDDTGNNGNLISEILASDGALPNPVTDVDTASLEGIAINGLNSSNGTWEYNIGSGWNPVGTVTWNSSLLLRDTDRLRFVPDGENADFATVTFTAWDQTSGTAGTKVDTAAYDPIGAFSFNVEVASINVTAVNDAPTVDLNGSDGGGTNFTTTFTEDGGAVNVTDVDSVIADVDDTAYLSLSVNLINFSDGPDEQIVIAGYTFTYGTGDPSVIRTVGGTTFELDFDGSGFNVMRDGGGTMPQADLQTLMRGITYENISQSPASGDRTINFIAQDAAGLLGPIATSTITVTPVNNAPVAVADSFTVNEGSTTNLNLASNDTDADDGLDLTSINIVSGPTNGSIVVNADGTVDYTHDGSETVADSITYTIDDLAGTTSNTVTVSLTVTPQNDSPVAVADSFTVNEGSTTNLNLAANDTDADDGLDLTSINIVSGPTNGSIVVNADGTVDYTHDGSETVADSFTYTIDDLSGATSNTVTVNLTITPVNNAPVAVADSFTVNEGSTTNLNLASNDTDADDGLDLTSINIVSGPTNGSIVVNADGTVDYTHDGSETVADSITYTIDDLAGTTSNTVTVNLTVTPVNDAPVVVADSFTVTEGSTTNLNLAANDSDADDGLDLTSISIVSGPTNGSIVVNADGTVDYTHDGSETVADSFTYTIDDLAGTTSNTVTVSLTVTPQNDSPVAVADSFTVNEGSTTNLNLAVNDSDADDGLDLTSIVITGAPTNGSIVVNADGTVDYTHDGSETLADSFTYTILDNSGAVSNTGTVSITVTPVNDAPVALADSFTVDEGSTTNLNLAANDSDADDGLDLTSITIVSGPTNGSIVVNADGTVDYTHNSNETLSDSFTYTIDDLATATSNTVTVSLTITPVNDAPVAVADSFTVNEGSTTNLDLAGNDTDADDGLDLTSLSIVSGPTNGSIVVNADGTVDYTHDGSETVADSFTYTIDDLAGVTSNTVTVSLTVTPQNDAPTAVADSFTVNEGSTTNLNLAANDTDADDGLDLTSIAIVSGPTNGSIVVNADGTVDYTHDGSETVADSFTYTIDDLAGATSNTVTVSLTVTPQNDAPTAVADSFTVNEGSTTNLNLAVNDSDADDGLDLTSIAIVSGPANGSIVVNADGTVDYTHDGSETVADSFTYTIEDLAGTTSNTVTVSLTITPVNDAPVAVADSFTVDEGSTTNLNLAANDTDADDGLDLTSLSIVSGPTNGSIVVNADGTVDYTHDGSETVADSFTYTIDDLAGVTSNTVTVSLTVTPQNDAPTAVADSFTVNEGSMTNLNLAANDTDADDGLDLTSITIVSGPTNGSIVVNADGTVDYTHDGSETVADSFTYTIDDLAGATSNTVVSLTITPVNDAPVAVADSFTVAEGSTTNLNLAANDTDADDGLDLTSIAIVSGPTNGSIVVNADGTVDYTHDGSETVADSFSYTIDDASGATSNVATVSITVTPVNDAPVAVADSFAVNEGSTTNLNLAANDSDADDGLDLASITIVSGPTNGSIVVNANGTVDYTHDGSATVADSFTYTIDDLAGATSNTVTVNLTVTPVNDAPVIAGTNTGAATKNVDPDADGLLEVNGALTISDPDTGESSFQAGTVVGAYGSLTIDAAGNWNYAADNTQAVIQQLNTGESISDVLTVTTADGTTHSITVTINGATATVDQGGDDPGPGPLADPIEPDPEPEPESPPDEILPVDDELPPREELAISDIPSSKPPVITPLQWADPTYFVPTISMLTTDNVLAADDGSPSTVVSIVKRLQRELASQTIERVASTVSALFSADFMAHTMDQIQQQLGETLEMDGKRGQVIIGAATGLGASVFAGYVIWAFRGSSLVLGALTAMPMWRCFDPLPVLMGHDKKCRDRDEAKSTEHDLDKDETTVKELLGEKQSASDIEGMVGRNN